MKPFILGSNHSAVGTMAHLRTATGQDEVLCAIPMVAPYCSLGGQVNERVMTGKAQASPIRCSGSVDIVSFSSQKIA